MKAEEIQLAIAITHVPDSEQRRMLLQRIIAALGPDLRQETSDFLIIRDTTRKGCWPTVKTAWILSMVGSETTHCLVLADDMLPCPDFLLGVKQAIAQKPDVPINLFSMRKMIEEARQRGDSWYLSRDNVWGGAAILPIRLVQAFLDWQKLHVPEKYPHDDGRLSMYLYLHNIWIWQTVPCLLEHIAPSASLLGHNNANRVARWYGPSALSIDWTCGLLSPLKEHRRPTGLSVLLQQANDTMGDGFFAE